MKITVTDSRSATTKSDVERLHTYGQISAKLSLERKCLGASQKSVAESSGVPSRTISHIERADVKDMSPRAIRALAEYYGIEDEITKLTNKLVGIHLREARAESGLTLREVSKAHGFKHQRISEMERGQFTDSLKAHDYADALGVSLNTMLSK